MNSDELQGKWKQLKGSVRQQFGKLTDDDLEVIAGHRDKLIGKLQERYGYAREEAQKRADEFMASAKTTGGTEQGQHMPPPSSQQPGSQQHQKR
jgi:uncharacterized protein YjbJ (UPF0337 family)